MKKTKKAMTLVELVIAIGIMGLLSVGISYFVGSGYKVYRYSHQELDSLDTASLVMRDFEKTARGYEPSNANTKPFYEATATRLTFTAFQRGDTYPASSKISYYLSNSTFYKTVTAPTIVTNGPPLYQDANKKTTIVAAKVSNTAIFSYFDENGNPLAIPTDLSKITMIQLSITINAGTAASESTTVQLRNLKTNL